MKRLIYTLLALTFISTAADAQRTLLLARRGLPYSEQQVIYEGAGNVFPAAKLNNYWSAGKHITSMTYGDHGWFLTFSLNSGILSQRTYDSFDFFSEDLFNDMQSQGFCLTDMAKGMTGAGNKWCFVYSSFPKAYKQNYCINQDWNMVKKWLSDQWQDGYYVTYVYFDGMQWYVVTTRNDDFIEQGYFWADSYETLKSKVTTSVWPKGYLIDLINYGPGGYLVMYSKKISQKDPCTQTYSIEPTDLLAKVKELWAANQHLQVTGSLIPAVANTPNADVSKSAWFTTMTTSQQRQNNGNISGLPAFDDGQNREYKAVESLFGQISDIDGKIHSGIYTMTGNAYCNGTAYDMGFAPLMDIQIFFKKMVVNGVEYPFIGWAGNSLRCYGTPGKMFTVSKDLSVDYRTSSGDMEFTFGMVKGNISAVFNYRKQVPSSVIGVQGDYVQDSEDPEVLKHNKELLIAHWNQIGRIAKQKLTVGEDKVFSECIASLANNQIEGLSK